MTVNIETKEQKIDGVFVADKVGDIRFLNFDNFKKYENKEEDYDKLGRLIIGHY